ncbi:VOC family protein [Mesorhizobium sp. M0435]|uniref:VOC family protein n=1 Tax=Mesorhizobium sp. M0435 TaxID=2956944 RepID=UPI0033383BB4
MQTSAGDGKPFGQLPDGTGLGAVDLRVTDIDRALDVWRDIFGLSVLAKEKGKVELGAGGRLLVVLHASAQQRLQTKSLGLYHVAIHIPSRKEFARAAARLGAAGYKHSASDHLATESIYLADPDGNGIELTFETFHRGRFENIDGGVRAVAADGSTHSGLEPLRIEELLGELKGDTSLHDPLPVGTYVGHIHLHIADPKKTTSFYADILGFEAWICAPRFGMYDAGTPSRRHIVAYNTWAGPDATRTTPDTAGLEQFLIEVPTKDALDGVTRRLNAANIPWKSDGKAILSSDPDGNQLRIALKKDGAPSDSSASTTDNV